MWNFFSLSQNTVTKKRKSRYRRQRNILTLHWKRKKGVLNEWGRTIMNRLLKKDLYVYKDSWNKPKRVLLKSHVNYSKPYKMYLYFSPLPSFIRFYTKWSNFSVKEPFPSEFYKVLPLYAGVLVCLISSLSHVLDRWPYSSSFCSGIDLETSSPYEVDSFSVQ